SSLLVRAGDHAPGRNGHAQPPDEGDDEEGKRDATAADLILANATIEWEWGNWIQRAVLNMLASEPGVGKTRFGADLLRRIHLGLPWPDGTLHNLKGRVVLWVAADNQHAELASLPGQFGFPPEALVLNAPRKAPFGGTMLDDPEDLKDFEARIL